MAAHYLEGQGNPSDSTHLSESGLPGIWQWPSTSGRVISLHRTEQLARRIEATATAGLPSELRIDALAPGKEAEGILFTVPAGQSLPGWRLAFTLIDSRTLETAASQRVASYGWIAAIVVVSVAVLGLLALGLVRRQVALTRLRNDLVANVTHELKTPLSSMRLLVDTLIQAPGLDPADPSAWSADDLRAKLFAGGHDVVMLTGHFSAGNLLAADYRTTLTAEEVLQSTADLRDSIVLALGCHGGFSIPSPDLLADASPDPACGTRGAKHARRDWGFPPNVEARRIRSSADERAGRCLLTGVRP